MSALLGVDDGFVQGKYDLADLFLLIAAILFAIAFVIRLMLRPVPIDATLIAAGLFCTAVALFVW